MIDELVLHVGDCKTGTTSIQMTLAEKRWIAPEQSVLYTPRVNHNPLARTLRATTEPAGLERQWRAQARAFKTASAQTGIISAEDFEFVDPARLDATLQRFMPEFRNKMRVIAYVRPHADRLLSSYCERVKKGNFDGSVRQMHRKFKNEKLLFYTPRFERWRDTFGEAFTLRPLIRDQLLDCDVVADFFQFLFRGAPVTFTNAGEVNSSLSLEDLAMMREIHIRISALYPDINTAQQALGWNIAPMLAAHRPKVFTKPALDRALAEDVAEIYAADAAALDAAFFEGQPMTRALEAAPGKAVEAPQSIAAQDHFSPAEIARFRALAEMFGRLMDADPRSFSRSARPPEHRSPGPSAVAPGRAKQPKKPGSRARPGKPAGQPAGQPGRAAAGGGAKEAKETGAAPGAGQNAPRQGKTPAQQPRPGLVVRIRRRLARILDPSRHSA